MRLKWSGPFGSSSYESTPLPTGAITWPQPRPYKCPICDGRGSVPRGFYHDAVATERPKCRGCGGTGVVRG